MAYREFQVAVTVADDSSKSSVSFDRTAFIYQTLDRESVNQSFIVNPGDAEFQVAMGQVTLAYAWAMFTDYPILIRPNGVSATQFIMHTNNIAATNSGAPAPAMCVALNTFELSSMRVAPITGASKLANVWFVAIGDPLNAYT